MINRITMETVACLRSKCHLRQNLILSWPWSFRHTSCISDAKQNTQTKNFVGHPGRHTWQYCLSLWFSARSVRRIKKSLDIRSEVQSHHDIRSEVQSYHDIRSEVHPYHEIRSGVQSFHNIRSEVQSYNDIRSEVQSYNEI